MKGRTVVVTRAAEQQGEGRRLLETLGAQVLDLPALVIGPPDQWGPLDDALADGDAREARKAHRHGILPALEVPQAHI